MATKQEDCSSQTGGLKLKGISAVVTGTGPNIGQAIAKTLAREGCRVVCNDLDMSQARKVAQKINDAGGTAIAIQADISKTSQVKAMMEKAVAEFGGIDILVNNVAVAIPKGLLDISEEEWRRGIDVTLTGTFLCSKYAAQSMVDQKKRGRIVNIASTSGHRGRKNAVAYCAGKGGILNLTRAMAMDLAPYGIRVNSVSPTRTGIALAYGKPHDASGVPLGRSGRPEDQAEAVLFMVSNEADFVTGTDLLVDGGSIATWEVHV
ncbi:MAG: SDR family oxidoreductase [Desulfatiglandales bacterium]|nr:SDR family oxidoreductase [Desulfatiglandales bacterium]